MAALRVGLVRLPCRLLSSIRCLSVGASSSQNIISKTKNASTSSSSTKNPYTNLFPWRNEIDLAKLLAANIVYAQGGLIGISKPYGLGMYRTDRVLVGGAEGKSRAEAILSSEVSGSPRYCLADVLDYLAQMLGVQRLHIVKSAHRDWSGLVVLSTTEAIAPHIEKSIRRARAATLPHMRFYCITNGIITKPADTERCGIRLLDIDDLAQYKEPIYVSPEKISKKLRKNSLRRADLHADGSIKPVVVQYRTLATNRDLAVSLVEVQSSVTKWSFLQCFLAYKASFVLGDTFFSHRVKHILGQPVVIQPKKTKSAAQMRNSIDYAFEPLSTKVQRALGVQRNAQLPLMIHAAGLTFPGLRRSTMSLKVEKIPPNWPDSDLEIEKNAVVSEEEGPQSKDIIINADRLHHLPDHFVHTLNCLGLNVIDSVGESSSTE